MFLVGDLLAAVFRSISAPRAGVPLPLPRKPDDPMGKQDRIFKACERAREAKSKGKKRIRVRAQVVLAAKDTIAGQRGTIRTLQDALRSHEVSVPWSKRKLEQLQEQYRTLQQQYNAVRLDYGALQGQVDAKAREKVAVAERITAEYRASRDKVAALYGALVRETQGGPGTTREELASLSEKLAQARALAEQWAARAHANASDVNVANERLSKLEQEHEKLRLTNENLHASLSVRERELDKLRASNEAFRELNGDLQQKLARLDRRPNHAPSAMQKEVDAYKDEVMRERRAREQAERDLARLREEQELAFVRGQSATESELGACKQDTARLRAELASAQTSAARWKADYERISSVRDQHFESLQACARKTIELERELGRLTEDRNTLAQKCAECADEGKRTRAMSVRLADERAEAVAQMGVLRQDLARAQEQAASLVIERDHLKAKNREAYEKKCEAEDALSALRGTPTRLAIDVLYPRPAESADMLRNTDVHVRDEP